ncbi:MAG: efflux RND transporter periplasmic adaptor subunit [Spirochaetaceae bacterium]|nr:efflux RND transporter periplasmic adaptor subunit [Spirochaetaceae bacterium]
MTDKRKTKKMKTTGIILIVLIVIVLAFLVINVVGGKTPIAGSPGNRPGIKSEKSMVYTVLTETMEPKNMENYLKFNSDITAETNVDIYPDTAGKLTKLNVSLGSYVRKGQVIAQVDPSLPGQVFVTSNVLSTITGTITDLPFKVGATIASTQVPVASVGNLTDLLAISYISEKDMASVARGQTATITFAPFKGEDFPGTITEISPVLDRNSRTLEIKIALTKKDPRIKSGMFGSVRLVTEKKKNVISVSDESLISSDGGIFVYVVTNGSIAEQCFVETGLKVDGRTEILSGLSEGDQVVIRGHSMLQNGSIVRLTE